MITRPFWLLPMSLLLLSACATTGPAKDVANAAPQPAPYSLDVHCQRRGVMATSHTGLTMVGPAGSWIHAAWHNVVIDDDTGIANLEADAMAAPDAGDTWTLQGTFSCSSNTGTDLTLKLPPKPVRSGQILTLGESDLSLSVRLDALPDGSSEPGSNEAS